MGLSLLANLVSFYVLLEFVGLDARVTPCCGKPSVITLGVIMLFSG
jgi:hypothetical protein